MISAMQTGLGDAFDANVTAKVTAWPAGRDSTAATLTLAWTSDPEGRAEGNRRRLIPYFSIVCHSLGLEIAVNCPIEVIQGGNHQCGLALQLWVAVAHGFLDSCRLLGRSGVLDTQVPRFNQNTASPTWRQPVYTGRRHRDLTRPGVPHNSCRERRSG